NARRSHTSRLHSNVVSDTRVCYEHFPPARELNGMEAEPHKVRAEFEAFYEAKWGGREGFWLDWYPRHLGLCADLLRQRNRAIAEVVPTGLERILDCGCGAGDVSALLHDHARAVVSFDVAGANARQAQKNLTARFGSARVLRAGGEDLPFADASFDAVVL